MHTSILKLVYIYNEPLHASANHVAICRNIKYKGEILYILYTLNVSNLCILYPRMWPHGWLKYVGFHSEYKLISIYF